MFAVELIPVHQWFPSRPHAAVSTTHVGTGMSYDNQDLIDRLRDAKGDLGVCWTFDGQHDWTLVRPGDWIVERHDGVIVMDDESFRKRFDVAPD